MFTDGVGSVSESVNTSGVVTAPRLYSPHGGVRCQSGTLPTDYGFTHQRSDASTSGLGYYNARYYDPVAGQFTSAVTTLAGGLNRYAYVGGNPETRTDPSGHKYALPPGGGELRLDPVPNRTNYHDGFYHDYWKDVKAGTGSYTDWLYYTVNKRPADGTVDAQIAAEETRDGERLAKYFGLTVMRQPERIGPTGKLPTADFLVQIQQGALPSGELPGGIVADVPDPLYSTDVELYTPKKGTSWFFMTRRATPAGIIGEAYEKGVQQASIIAIDISNVDPNAQMNKSALDAKAAQIVYWTPRGHAQAASRVARVIFIRNDQVVDDYNPIQFGPPAPEDRPMQILRN